MGSLIQLLPSAPWPLNSKGQVMSIDDDPVRPDLDLAFRFSNGREVYANHDAVICVAYCTNIPFEVSDLDHLAGGLIAVFYTVWSYGRGAGRDLVLDIFNHLRKNRSELYRFVTLSPKTEMAKKFHLKNGAILFRENPNSYNFEYLS